MRGAGWVSWKSGKSFQESALSFTWVQGIEVGFFQALQEAPWPTEPFSPHKSQSFKVQVEKQKFEFIKTYG